MLKASFTDNGIHYRHWAVNGETRAVVLIVHGLGEHCERYDHVATALNASGYAVCSLDLPGHGKSQGPRGHIDRFDQFPDAVLGLYDKVSQHYAAVPVFLLGHSMGGLIATQLLLEQQSKFSGAILSGAAIKSPQEPPAAQVMIMRAIEKILPKLGVMTLDASGISRDPSVVENYMQDPLVNKGKLSARFLVEMVSTMEQCQAQAANIELPMLILHGGDDAMTSPSGSQQLFDAVSSKDKTLKIYDGLMHEILNEPEGPEISQEILAWMDSR